MYPIYVLPVSTSPKFHSVSLYDNPFWSYRPFWEKSAPKSPQMTFNTTNSNVPLMCYLGPWFPNFTPYPSTAISLRYRALWYKCTEWPQNDLEPYKVKCTPYMYTLPESQISLCFALRPAVFEIQAILKKVHRMTPTWPWMGQGNSYLVYVLLLSTSFKSQSISLYDQPFSRCRPFWDKWMTANWPWTLQGQIALYMYN